MTWEITKLTLKNDNNGLNREEIAKKANALPKCVTNVIDLNGLIDTKMDLNDFRNDLIDYKYDNNDLEMPSLI